MGKFGSVVMATVYLYLFLSISETSESVCREKTGKKRGMALTINSMRNERDEWVTKISASQNVSAKPKNLDVDLTRSMVDCDEYYHINVQGIVRDNVGESSFPNFQGVPEGVHQVSENAEKTKQESLTFHHISSRNVVITNNGRTLQKLIMLKPREGSALTNRPLKDNEIFTLRIDDMSKKLSYGIGIGVTTHVPGTFEIPESMRYIGTGTWMFYDNGLYHKSALLQYMRMNLKDVKAGQRIGVMRSDSGVLHFFLDGVDQGSYALNIPDKLYGVLECYGNLLQGTIVDA